MPADRTFAKDILGLAIIASIAGLIAFEAGELRARMDTMKEEEYLEKRMDSFPRGGNLSRKGMLRHSGNKAIFYKVTDSNDRGWYYAVAAEMPSSHGILSFAVQLSLKGELQAVKKIRLPRFSNPYAGIAASDTARKNDIDKILGQTAGKSLMSELDELLGSSSIRFSDIIDFIALCAEYAPTLEAKK